jgi:hypothetical protein
MFDCALVSDDYVIRQTVGTQTRYDLKIKGSRIAAERRAVPM